jgi:hypothetical protein
VNPDSSKPRVEPERPEPAPSPTFARRILNWLPELIFLAVTTAVGIWAGGRWCDPVGDPGFTWSLAYRLAEGNLLYRDVYLPYAPLTPYLLAAVGYLFEFSAGSQVISTWIAAVAAGLLLLRCGRPFLTTLERTSAAGVILALSLWAPGPGRLVFPYYPGVVHALALSIGALLVMASTRLAERTRCWLAGILAGLAFLSKQEIGLAILIALFAPLILRPKGAFARGARILAGYTLVIALGASFVLSSASISTLRDQNHLWPLDLTPPAELSHLFRLAAGMKPVDWFFDLRQTAWNLLVQLGLLSCAGLLFARERTISRWRPILALFIALVLWRAAEPFRLSSRAPVALSATIAVLVAALALVHRRLENREQLVAIGTFAGLAGLRAVFSPTVSGAFDGPAHFATSLTWVLFLCVFAPRILAPSPRAAVYARRLTAVMLLIGAWNGARIGAESLRFPWKESVGTLRGTIYLDGSNASFYRLLSRELEPGEKVLVLPEINAVDVLFDVRSVSPLQDHLPGWLDPPLEEALIALFEREPPSAVVVFNRPLHEFGIAELGQGYGARLTAWIEHNYRPVESGRRGSILRRRSESMGKRLDHARTPAARSSE